MEGPGEDDDSYFELTQADLAVLMRHADTKRKVFASKRVRAGMHKDMNQG